ncbi:hypothetical protein HOI26_02830 [Candidatus Woesearchaeota archaeon]|jgi:hypothetical protein|nr:hypothetical protein [Candidatus Woesearchaeota archaeon]MBT5740012.1 hypothetical protein [Candidatus Woesearchaeota archaeon]
MTNPLDMCDTIAFYENTPEVDKKLDVILGQTFGFYVPKVRSLCLAESEHYQFSFAQMRKIVDKLPKNAQIRLKAKVSGNPDLWFSNGNQPIPTSDIDKARSPTAIIPSYIEFSADGVPKIQLYGLGKSIENVILTTKTARIIQAEGLLHEVTHAINWLGRREIYNGQPKSTILQFPDGEKMSALDALKEFGNVMATHSPMSHYSSFYWEPSGNGIKTFHDDPNRDDNDIRAIDEELAETVAAYTLGFTFTSNLERRLDPFVDRPEVKTFVRNYLNAKLVE